jgi:DNA repair exonuclease SbcCD ATPase subunit
MSDEDHGAALLEAIERRRAGSDIRRHAEAVIADAKSFAELVATTTVERDAAIARAEQAEASAAELDRDIQGYNDEAAACCGDVADATEERDAAEARIAELEEQLRDRERDLEHEYAERVAYEGACDGIAMMLWQTPAGPSDAKRLIREVRALISSLATERAAREKAEGERDQAINEAHAAREARRMTEEALAVWKDRAERRVAWIRGHSGGEHSTFCASLGHHPTTCDCELHDALADEPPGGADVP